MLGGMGELSFLTNHARVLRFLAGDPTARLRDIASVLGTAAAKVASPA
jgi:hypothetical protein